MKLALGVPGVDVTMHSPQGQTVLYIQCSLVLTWEETATLSCLADPRVDVNLGDEDRCTPLNMAASLRRKGRRKD